MEKLSDKSIILTFDDGYKDFYTDAFPILKKYNMKATNYLIVNHVGRSGNLSGSMIKELIDSGLITIGAHTLNHISLVSTANSSVRKEIYDSKEKLEKDYGIKVYDFAYPYGFFNNDVMDLVKKAGYQTAASTILGATQSSELIFRLPRIRVGNYAGKEFLDRIEKVK